MTDHTLTRLYPEYKQSCRLHGLYLKHRLHKRDTDRPYVYTNYVASLDGRIAIKKSDSGDFKVPDNIANDSDWRLYQELAAQADVLLVSARYIRELAEKSAQDSLPVSEKDAFADLHGWRREQDLTPKPAVVILSASLDIPLQQVRAELDRTVYIATGEQSSAEKISKLQDQGAKILITGQKLVEGGRLIQALAEEGFASVYSIAGPGVFETLVKARVLDRLYFTQVHRLLGGDAYDTLLEGKPLSIPADFKLQELYFDTQDTDNTGQLYAVYDAIT